MCTVIFVVTTCSNNKNIFQILNAFELPKANLSQFSRTQEKLKQFQERLVEERKKRLEERKKQRKEDRRKAFYCQKEEEAQRIHEEQLKKGLYSEFSFVI